MKKGTLAIIVGLILILGVAGILRMVGRPGQSVEVVQWSNSHMMREGLMPDMEKRFNEAGYTTKSGKRIVVKVFIHGSGATSDDLISRITKNGVRVDKSKPDPTVVTPSSADWLVRANYATKTTLVDLDNARTIAKSYVGIVTYQDMAEALGWPDKQIGYADIIALRNNPEGWASMPKAKAGWGQKPLVAFTDPITSSTGRSVLFGLYGIGAGKAPERLVEADVMDPNVVEYVKGFQSLIDHYMIGTIPLNTKIYQGPGYGHFFIMPEDNLISLYEGSEEAIINGVEVKAPPIDKPMVMIYPKEGVMVRNNIAGIVNAPWVTADQVEGAQKWIDFLLQDEQQRAFMRSGFRPGTNLPLTDPASKITGKYGLTPDPKVPLLNPEKIDSVVAAAIEESWVYVKKSAIVTFAVDVSASMSGTKLDQAKQGMIRALDSMAQNNQVGFLTFSDAVSNRVAVAPLAQNRFAIANTVESMKVQTNTALYDGIRTAIEMTDMVSGQPDAIRAVVVLTDGLANRGETRLDNLIKMISINEIAIRQFRGFEGDPAYEENGRRVQKQDVIGAGLAIKTEHPIQIFFIGIGEDADMEVGRMLAQATGAEFQGVTDEDLAQLLEEFSKYF